MVQPCSVVVPPAASVLARLAGSVVRVERLEEGGKQAVTTCSLGTSGSSDRWLARSRSLCRVCLHKPCRLLIHRKIKDLEVFSNSFCWSAGAACCSAVARATVTGGLQPDVARQRRAARGDRVSRAAAWRAPTHSDRRRNSHAGANASELTTDIAVIGGGATGIGVIASLLKRSPGLRISLIEPADTHYYQPGWTLVGGGAYAQGDTARPMAGLVPPGVEWLRTASSGSASGAPTVAGGRRQPGIPQPDRLPRPAPGLGAHRGPGGDPGAQRRRLQLPLRPGALHLGAGARPAAAARR